MGCQGTSDEKERPPVCVCIPTYNSGRTIDICLESLERNLVDGDYVAVYDRFSTDETAGIARRHGFNLFHTEESLGEIRTKVLNQCKNDWVFFLDSDIYIPDHFIEDLFRWMRKLERVGAIQGLPINTLNPKFCKLDTWSYFERTTYPTVLTYRGSTGNTLVWKEAAKGFDSHHSVFEDWALLQHLRSKRYNWWAVDLIVPHDNPNYKNASLWSGAGIRLTRTKPLWKMVLAIGWMPMKAPFGVKTIQLKGQIYMLWGYLRYQKYLIKQVSKR